MTNGCVFWIFLTFNSNIIMYQIAIRRIAPEVKVFDFAFGSIVDGHFVPADVNILPIEVFDLICLSDLFSSQAYIKADLLADFAKIVLNAGASIELYPNFVVFTLPEGYVTEEKEK